MQEIMTWAVPLSQKASDEINPLLSEGWRVSSSGFEAEVPSIREACFWFVLVREVPDAKEATQ